MGGKNTKFRWPWEKYDYDSFRWIWEEDDPKRRTKPKEDAIDLKKAEYFSSFEQTKSIIEDFEQEFLENRFTIEDFMKEFFLLKRVLDSGENVPKEITSSYFYDGIVNDGNSVDKETFQKFFVEKIYKITEKSNKKRYVLLQEFFGSMYDSIQKAMLAYSTNGDSLSEDLEIKETDGEQQKKDKENMKRKKALAVDRITLFAFGILYGYSSNQKKVDIYFSFMKKEETNAVDFSSINDFYVIPAVVYSTFGIFEAIKSCFEKKLIYKKEKMFNNTGDFFNNPKSIYKFDLDQLGVYQEFRLEFGKLWLKVSDEEIETIATHEYINNYFKNADNFFWPFNSPGMRYHYSRFAANRELNKGD